MTRVGETLVIFLTVTSEYNKSSAKVTQKITVVNDSIPDGIMQPRTEFRVDEVIIFGVHCSKWCQILEESNCFWEFENLPNFDYENNTANGQNNKLFTIKPNTLTEGQTYTVKLKYYDTVNAVKKFSIFKTTEIKNCKANPSSGKAGKTIFKIQCDYPKGDYTFEVHAISKTHKTRCLIIRDYELDYIRVVLPADCDFEVILEDIVKGGSQTTLPVTISYAYNKTDNVTFALSLLDVYVPIIQRMIFRLKHRAIQLMICIAQEFSQQDAPEMIPVKIYVKIKMLEVVNKSFTFGSIGAAKQATSVVLMIMQIPTGGSHALLGKLSTDICYKIANQLYASIHDHPDRTTLTNLMADNAEYLMACAEMNTQPSFDLLDSHFPNMTTAEYPVVERSSISEEYDDYASDDVVNRYLQLEDIARNYIHICHMSGRSIGATMLPGSIPVERVTNWSTIYVAKLNPEKYFFKGMKSQNITLAPHRYFTNISDDITVMLCTNRYDPFWWNQQKVKTISTNIAVVKVLSGNTTVERFEREFDIFFPLNNETISRLPTYSGSTPIYDPRDSSISSMKIATQDTISVHRIDTKANSLFIVVFQNLSVSDYFDVIITDFARPTMNDFEERQVISINSPTIFQDNNNKYDSWKYLAILPNAKVVHPNIRYVFDYTFSIFSPVCNRWNVIEKKWERACKLSHADEI